MKLSNSLLLATSALAQCPGLSTMDWWTEGHSKVSCTNGKNKGSKCKIQCNSPWVSSDDEDPNGHWKVECRGSNPTWKTPKTGGRSDHGCYQVSTTAPTTPEAVTTAAAQTVECPKANEQTKPHGGKIVSTVNQGGKAVGLELKVRFDDKYATNKCEKFVFALRSTIPFPEDATFQALGATATFISPDRKVVTFQPDAAMESIKHNFWKPGKHDGTRVYIYGSDLSSLKTGEYSIKAHVACNTDARDLSCISDASAVGVSLTPPPASNEGCATTAPPTTDDPPTTGDPPTTEPGPPAPNTPRPPTSQPSTPPTTPHTDPTVPQTDPTAPLTSCQFAGTHDMGANPNWWQSGNLYEYQGYIHIPLSSSITGGWYVEVVFQNAVESMQFWSGQAQKMDTQGFRWRFTGWCNQTWSNNIDLTYIGRTSVQGGNSLALAGNGQQNLTFCQDCSVGVADTANTDPCPDSCGPIVNPGGGDPVTPGPPTTPGPVVSTQPLTTPVPCTGENCSNGVPTPPGNRCNNPQNMAPQPAQQTQLSPKAGATDYERLIHMSILFYEAQRAGKQPANNRIPWRGDSAMDDGCDVGHDLTGGWYDAGDFVKFNFPMAYSVTTLAWGMLSFETGYRTSGEWDNAVDQIRWVTDYLIKCHTGSTELYGQTANGHQDHTYWGRPEEYPFTPRTSHKITASNPGADLAGETAAALAAASLVYTRHGDLEQASLCLQHAQEIFEFANSHRDVYTSGIGDASSFYNSWSGFQDELIWGSAWIAKATGNADDISRAEQMYNENNGSARNDFSWDNKAMGAQIVMYELTGKSSYRQTINNNVAGLINDGPYTPGGMIYRETWGPARHAMNAAFIASQAAASGINSSANYQFARSQVQYMMGQNPQNQCFVVGFGDNCPVNPHHRSSSCPASGSCDGAEHANGSNPMILYGALVGGPNQNDQYTDDRTDYIANEVACDYNAGWQGTLAAMVEQDL